MAEKDHLTTLPLRQLFRARQLFPRKFHGGLGIREMDRAISREHGGGAGEFPG